MFKQIGDIFLWGIMGTNLSCYRERLISSHEEECHSQMSQEIHYARLWSSACNHGKYFNTGKGIKAMTKGVRSTWWNSTYFESGVWISCN